ncbi:hypothetical protein BBJ28_00006840 [Nothophytophthora sp. Chile5]|nr:hypothetical protein BBJ28_00006840 [Nothophytophthora sp. Chile5]
MLVRVPGWEDADVLALLRLFRTHLRVYIYASVNGFVETAHAELPVIQADGQEIYVHEHLYETMSELLENKIGGGLWLPDELICFFQKAKQYHSLLQSSPEVYFKRIQIWGATGYVSISLCLFDKAPPAFRAPKVGVINSKAPKLWSPGELAMLVDFLVRITKEVQTTGTSELVKNVTETLRKLLNCCVLAVLNKNRRKKELGIQPSRRKLRPTTTREASADLSKCSVESKAEASSDTKAAVALSSSHTGVKRTEESKPAAVSPASNLPRQRATAEAYTEFVRDMAAHYFGTLKEFEHLVLTKSDPDAPADHYRQVVEEQERAFEPLGGAEPSMLDTPNASPSWDEDGRPTPEKRIANERGDDEHGDGVQVASSTYEGEEKSSSAPGKQSSPANVFYLLYCRSENDNWDGEDGASDGDADVDDDGLENQSVDSSDNACACYLPGFKPSGDAFGFDRTKKPSKRGKDENYGKRFVLAKKRRFEAKKPSADKKDDDEEEVEGEDDGDQQSEDANEPPADSESVSSEEEQEEEEEEEKPHPLQGILDSLGAHIANLQAKQRELIERKEDRERRQYRHMRGEYGTSMDDMQSYLSGA